MLDTHMSQAQRNCLPSAAKDLHEQFRGVFGEETIQPLLFSSYAELAATATIDRWGHRLPAVSPASGSGPWPQRLGVACWA